MNLKSIPREIILVSVSALIWVLVLPLAPLFLGAYVIGQKISALANTRSPLGPSGSSLSPRMT